MLLTLTGKSLGERQKELNYTVNHSASVNLDFNLVKEQAADSDVDNLFKIDLASKYKNIDYIIEVLKAGDSLYITRAIKSNWIYDDKFSNVISVDYLQSHVFPEMSLKMKKKFLTTMSVQIKNEDRAQDFFNYCLEVKLMNIALKFLVYTSEAFKLQYIESNSSQLFELRYKGDFKQFIGRSFTVANAYLEALDMNLHKAKVCQEMSYLYAVSKDEYLNMIEKHLILVTPDIICNLKRLGLRISKDILTKHKDRVIENPELYVNFLNKDMIVLYSTSDNAKMYSLALLYKDVNDFWNGNFCSTYEFIINLIPAKERFPLMKQIFNYKYTRQPFEMDLRFYQQQCYKIMTAEEQEKWALDHIASQTEILGAGKDHVWYKFVNFERAMKEIKRLAMITTDNFMRGEIVQVLVDAARTQRDLQKLFEYYHDRHNNEQRYIKENFVDRVIYTHNVYEFDRDCWLAFNKILQNLCVYSDSDDSSKCEFKLVAIIYHVINHIEIPEPLKLYMKTNMYFYALKINTDKLPQRQADSVFQYLFEFYMGYIHEIHAEMETEDIKYRIRKYLYFILDLLSLYNKSKKDVPELVSKLLKLDWDEFCCHSLMQEKPKKTSQADMLRLLKKDSNAAVKHIPLVRANIETMFRFNISQFLKKLRVYFKNDVALDFLKLYRELLSERKLCPKVAQAAAYGIFHIADYAIRVEFMKSHAPTEGKINRNQMNEKLLYIQEAICSTAFYSRPPVPLDVLLMYVKGDYVPRCLPMFNSYLVHLTAPKCVEFIDAVLNNPVSVQKHGLRLAFDCFKVENLRKLVLNIWKKSKNISLRSIIYKALFSKIVNEDLHAQTALFETLCTLTLQLYQDDDKEVFALLTSGRIPRHLRSDYMTSVWTAVNALPDNNTNLQRKSAVIRHMHTNIESIRQDVVRPVVEEFLKTVFEVDSTALSPLLTELNPEAVNVTNAKWDLTARHILYIKDEDDYEIKWQLLERILDKCLSKFDLVVDDIYVMRIFCFNFVRNLLDQCYVFSDTGNDFVNMTLGSTQQKLQLSLPIEDTYLILWEMRIDIAIRKAINEAQMILPTIEDVDAKSIVVKDILINLGKDIGTMIKVSMEQDMYFKSFVHDIQNKLISKALNIPTYIEYDINSDDALVATCFGLLEFKNTETYLFILGIVPLDYSSMYEEEYKSVLIEIKNYDEIEIRCVFREKFYNTDFKPRAILEVE